jgi:hypothetical protein
MIQSLVFAVLMTLHLVPPDTAQYTVDTISGGEVLYSVTVTRGDTVDYVRLERLSRDTPPEFPEMDGFEIERSNERSHIYLVYPSGVSDTWTFDIQDFLLGLHPVSSHPVQTVVTGSIGPQTQRGAGLPGTGPESGTASESGPAVSWRILSYPELIYLGSRELDMVCVIRRVRG